ncbi:hypothetical protein JCM10207_008471 [Rhodosporidiobolus poonsookiae]
MSDYRSNGRRSSRGGGGGGGYDRDPYPLFDDRDPYDRPPPPRRGDDFRGEGRRGGYDDRRDSRGYAGPPPYERSPEMGRGKRRRSPSPGRRGGDDYYDRPPRDYDSRGPPRFERDSGYGAREPHPPGFHGPPSAAPRAPLEAPHQLPYRVNHAYFSDWFRSSNPPSLAESDTALADAWKKYEADITKREGTVPFDDLKGMRWFVDKYGIGKEETEERDERRRKAREGRVERWVEKARKGELDGVNYDFDERRRVAIVPNEATLAQQQAAAAVASGKDDKPTERNGDGSENGDASATPAAPPKPPTEDELPASSPEMVMLKPTPEQITLTRVPPEAAAKDLEAFFSPFDGFVRFSISDATPHAGFLRLAWATFSSAETAKVALDTILATAPKPAATDATAAANGEKADAASTDVEMSEKPAAEAEEPKAEDESKDKPDDAAAEPAEPLPYSLGTYVLSAPGILTQRLAPLEARIRAAPALMSTPDRVKTDLDNVAKVVQALEAGLGEAQEKGSEAVDQRRRVWEEEVEGKREGMDVEVYKGEMAAVTKRTLDLSLSYLRSAFDVCYYCCVACDSPEQLADMCPKHVRRADDGEKRRNFEAVWADGFDKRVPLLFPRDQIDARDYGADSRDEELFRLVSPHVRQEEEGKFRCKECNKLFSARKFVEKHVALKHSEIVGDALEQLAFFNNYILDPARIPLAPFQRENYLPSILAPPPPPPRFNHDRPLADRIGPKRPRIEPRRDDAPALTGPPLPPPQGKSLDPRASRGASSYADLDGAPGGDAEDLPY